MPEYIRLTGFIPWSTNLPVVKEEDDSSRSSSIGKDSDALSGGSDSDEDDGEVQSKDNRPLNDLNDPEKVFPMKALVRWIIVELGGRLHRKWLEGGRMVGHWPAW
ncbi:hypothetical protein L1987_82568 [Smallanthus sonchifolius]|uniref:Uncharacterized protein n=1 Tax=Smallanthus sonchifolius TaxID=185202 RepID=A0ACB8YBE1_9ASTR|nr:hypothetical protein L1987_82568 [Smallanthus sonchifolius]